MKVLVVGGGGREHAIVKKLKESPKITTLYAAPGNGGISCDAVCVPVKATDIAGMVDFALTEAIDFVVVAPDDPLVLGMVDALTEKGIRCFGPNKAAAIFEGSKVFSKAFMKKYAIPTAAYEAFDEVAQARAYVQTAAYPLWIKTDGLALGKGAIVAADVDEALAILETVMVDKAFGDSGSSIVIEENMTGPEVTVLSFSDGKTLVPMVSSMDHKRAYDGDEGLNTGGMGVIAPNPHYTPEIAAQCMQDIFMPTVQGMLAENRPFKGCLYFGIMLTPTGPRVVEYNCRFGDPETQAVLALLDTDLLTVMEAVCDGTLDTLELTWKPHASACVVLASGGYPEKYETGLAVSGLDESGNIAGVADAVAFHAGTTVSDGVFRTAGGRVFGVTAIAPTLPQALDKAYAAADHIHFAHKHYRTDIGKQ